MSVEEGNNGIVDTSVEENQPWYVKYGLRGMGTFAGGMAMILGAMSFILSILSPTCMLFSIWQMLVGFVVITVEAPFCCAFVDQVQVITRKIEDKPLFIKAGIYIAAPLPTIIFCFGFNTFIGSGLIIATGVVYAMIALGKKASREEMAQNAQGFNSTSSTYQPNQTQPDKSSYSSNTTFKDPVQAAAALWASQSAPRPQTFEPPPSYKQSVSNDQNRPAWDQTFVNETTSSRSTSQPGRTSYGVNAVPSDPHNPFQ